MRLTEEQKRKRKEFAEICKRLDKERGRDKIKYNLDGDDRYRSFVIFDDTVVNEGGWYGGRKWMTAKYLKACVNRWVKRSYETGEQEPDCELGKWGKWIPHQCGGCRWFAALDLDYGFCCNLDSQNEGRVTFEHGGCKEHSDYELGQLSREI